jgi:glycosidase
LFEKLPIFWSIAERRPEFPRFYKQVIALRNQHGALRNGSMDWLPNSDESRVVSYVRRGADEEVLVVINFSNRSFFGAVEVANGSAFQDVTPDINPPLPPDAPAPQRESRTRVNSLPSIAIDAWGYRILTRRARS